MLQIHEKIERARVSAGLTQDEMAKKLGIKRSTYQYWEKKTPGIDKIKEVAKVLNLPDDYFLGKNDETFVPQPTIIEEAQKQPINEGIALYRDIYERLLSERMATLEVIKAAKKELAERAKRAEEQVDKFFELMNGSLSELATNSKMNLAVLEKVLLVVRSDDSATHFSLDRLEKKPEGSNATTAGKIELAAEANLRRKDKKNRRAVGK